MPLLSAGHGIAIIVDHSGRIPAVPRSSTYISLYIDRFSHRAEVFDAMTANITAESTANILTNRYIPLRDACLA